MTTTRKARAFLVLSETRRLSLENVKTGRVNMNHKNMRKMKNEKMTQQAIVRDFFRDAAKMESLEEELSALPAERFKDLVIALEKYGRDEMDLERDLGSFLRSLQYGWTVLPPVAILASLMAQIASFAAGFYLGSA